jgi:hypothetical protein
MAVEIEAVARAARVVDAAVLEVEAHMTVCARTREEVAVLVVNVGRQGVGRSGQERLGLDLDVDRRGDGIRRRASDNARSGRSDRDDQEAEGKAHPKRDAMARSVPEHPRDLR